MKNIIRFFAVILTLFLVCQLSNSCAQRGRPSGGPKDSIPPVFVNSTPENFTTNFKSKTIRINFDEYIKLDEPTKQILISPPMENKPTISPQGQASKYVEIEILDTLKPHTTYTINFGQSIVDNNEANPLPFFKYVFSTGTYIDSLSLSGRINDAYKRKTEEYISVMLYKQDSSCSDSIIYQKTPTYIAYTQDSTHTFHLENMEAGDYKIVAIKDKNQNYLFNPRQDKIGFLTDTIHLPTDKTYDLRIFKEIPDFRAVEIKQISKRHLLFAFDGKPDSVQINLISPKPKDFEASYYRQTQKDSIDYWFKPSLEKDSLYFEVQKEEYRDTLLAVLKEADADSLKISADPTSTLPLGEKFQLSANTPLEKIDASRVDIINKDSLQIPFKMKYNSTGNKLFIDFDTKEKERYVITALPGAITDFYGEKNDTLIYKLNTKPESEYANLTLNVQNVAHFPVIVQLVDKNGKTQREIIHHQADGTVFKFKFLPAGLYYVRIIYDTNDNGVWDTGSYLKKRQPEKVIYMKKPLDVRKNWDISQTFILKQ